MMFVCLKGNIFVCVSVCERDREIMCLESLYNFAAVCAGTKQLLKFVFVGMVIGAIVGHIFGE